MTHRIPLDHLTSDALDALYERLEAAEDTETQRQLATAREALASATTRAARAEAAIARARALHQPVGVVAAAEFGNPPDCAICGPNCQPCPTIRALDGEPPTPAATQATDTTNQLAATLREVLDSFAAVRNEAGTLLHHAAPQIFPEQFEKWRAALNQTTTKEQ